MNLTKEKPMTLIIFISACLLTFGIIQFKEALEA